MKQQQIASARISEDQPSKNITIPDDLASQKDKEYEDITDGNNTLQKPELKARLNHLVQTDLPPAIDIASGTSSQLNLNIDASDPNYGSPLEGNLNDIAQVGGLIQLTGSDPNLMLLS